MGDLPYKWSLNCETSSWRFKPNYQASQIVSSHGNAGTGGMRNMGRQSTDRAKPVENRGRGGSVNSIKVFLSLNAPRVDPAGVNSLIQI